MDPHPRHNEFPQEAVTWLLGTTPRTVAVLGDAVIAAACADRGHDVTNVEGTSGTAPLPFTDGSVDAVLTARGVPRDLEEIVRVLRPGGELGLIRKIRDRRIPWARKLDVALSLPGPEAEPASRIAESENFSEVTEDAFRHWQMVNNESLPVVLTEELAHLDDTARQRRIEAAMALYSGYGRGADGMQLPWVSQCFKATVTAPGAAPTPRAETTGASPEPEPEPNAGAEIGGGIQVDHVRATEPQDGSDSDLLLIDFR